MHAPAGFRDAVLREDLDIGTEWRFAVFTARNARTALASAEQVIYMCLVQPQTGVMQQGAEPSRQHLLRLAVGPMPALGASQI